MLSTGDRQRWSDERKRFDDVQRAVRTDAGPLDRLMDEDPSEPLVSILPRCFAPVSVWRAKTRHRWDELRFRLSCVIMA